MVALRIRRFASTSAHYSKWFQTVKVTAAENLIFFLFQKIVQLLYYG